MDDIILNKCENIERSIKRVKKTYHGNEKKFATDFDIQDIIMLNLQRACDASIDIAMHLIKIKKLGIPKDSKEAFLLLSPANIIPAALSQELGKMVGFRNAIIHEYTNIDYTIVQKVLEHHVDALSRFAQTVLRFANKNDNA